MAKAYFDLIKPGIIGGNIVTTASGFFLASGGHVNLILLVSVVVGIALVIASGCVFNNYIDREIDRKMVRTKNRELVVGSISIRNAIVYAVILALLGFGILLLYVNILTTGVAAIGLFFYVVVYSIWKRRSVNGTLVGSISGAVVPVVGYVSVANNLDIGAFLLFLTLIFWQMPHFYAIGIYRLKEYKAAGIPILPIEKGISVTKKHMSVYIVGFFLVTMLFTPFRQTGFIYLIVMSIVGGVWIYISYKGTDTKDADTWAKKMFGYSLVVLLTFCIMVSIDFALPL